MIRSQLGRAGIRHRQTVSLGFRLVHNQRLPLSVQTKLKNMSKSRSKRSVSLIPNLHSNQFISEEVADKSSIMTYEKANILLSETELLAREDSPFRLVLLKFLELEILKVNAAIFDDLKKLIQFILKVRKHYSDYQDLVRFFDKSLSNTTFPIFNMIYNPRYLVAFMNKDIEIMLKDKEIENESKIQQLYHKLNLSHAIKEQFKELKIEHDELLIIHFRNMNTIFEILDRKDYLQFYIKLLECDCSTISSRSSKILRYALQHGQPQEQEVYEFSALLTLEDEESSNLLKMKLLKLYSFEMIRGIVVKYIQNSDTEKAEFYMEYFLAKYALEKSQATPDKQKMLTAQMYEVITYHAVRLKNYASALELLKTLKVSDIPITPKLLHILATSLRKKKLYDAVLVVLNKTASIFEDFKAEDNVTRYYKNLLAAELFITLRDKFPNNPKVFVSQFISIFEGSEVMLNELGILSLLYNGTVDEIRDLDTTLPTLYKAEVSDFFKVTNGFPSVENMTELYIAVLNYVGMHQHNLDSEQVFRDLFDRFQNYVIKIQALNVQDHPFAKGRIDEGIINVFVSRIIKDIKKPHLSAGILKSFLQNCDFKRFDGAAVSWIIYYHKFAESHEIDELINIVNKLEVPLGFYALTSLILRADRLGYKEEAHKRYLELLKLENPITHYDLIQLIKKNKWELPANFDKSLLEAKYMTTEERRELEFAQNEEVIINDPDFVDELSSTLDLIKQRKKLA